MKDVRDFISKEDEARVVEAITKAESETSGEIRVHIEAKCAGKDPMKRAIDIFNDIKMYETRERNGVLIYIAYESRVLAIIGDKGINEVVEPDFWDSEKETLKLYLQGGKPADGLCEILDMIGKKLSKFFPHQSDDVDELSNEISYGK